MKQELNNIYNPFSSFQFGDSVDYAYCKTVN